MRKKIEQEKDLKIDEIDKRLESLEKRKNRIFSFAHKLFKFESVSSTMSIVALVAVFHIGLVFYALLIGSMARLLASMTYRLHLSFKLTKIKRQISALKTKKFQKLSKERTTVKQRKYSKLKPFGILRRKNINKSPKITRQASFVTNKSVFQKVEDFPKSMRVAAQAIQLAKHSQTDTTSQTICQKSNEMER